MTSSSAFVSDFPSNQDGNDPFPSASTSIGARKKSKKSASRVIEMTDYTPVEQEANETFVAPQNVNVNLYQQRKILAQGMMDVALLTANANQLRITLDQADDPYYYVNVILIAISISVQLLIGLLLIWNSNYDINTGPSLKKANKINNITIIGIFLVTVVNIFISAFGITINLVREQTDNTPSTSIAIAS